MSLNEQVYLSVHAIVFGFFIATCFDIVRVLCVQMRNIAISNFFQVLFWVFQVPLLIVYIYQVNGGIFHFYIVIFLLVGAVLYFKFFHKLFFTHLSALGEHTEKVIKFVTNTVDELFFKPIRFIFRTISDIIKLPKKILLTLFRKFRRKKLIDE